jgi:hypothetical protein
MKRRHLVAFLAAAVAVAWWWVGLRDTADSSAAGAQPPPASARRADTSQLRTQVHAARGRTGAIDWESAAQGDTVAITGHVWLVPGDHVGVADVEVVFRSADGEASARSDHDGAYRIDVARGTYHAFVRDDHVLVSGRAGHVRLPGPPSADDAESPDDTIAPTVVATADVSHLDLGVTEGGVVEGRVLDPRGRAIADAVVRATGNGLRPAAGTDIARTDAGGRYKLIVTGGHYILDATSPQLVGVAEPVGVDVAPGDSAQVDLRLVAGCAITGRVVGAHGEPALDGALESSPDGDEKTFGPTGSIAADGTFRWVTTAEGDVSLRAWPWKSPHSTAQRFACRDGTRYDNVVFQLPARTPDISGVVVDAQGQPVPGAFVDLAPLDNDSAQQERADATGRWGVYNMPPGRYRVTVAVAGRGVATADITAPVANVQLALSGVGKVTGTVAEADATSVQVQLASCGAGIALDPTPQLVTVVDHQFVVDDVPACPVAMAVTWQGQTGAMVVDVPAGGVAQATVTLVTLPTPHREPLLVDEDVVD